MDNAPMPSAGLGLVALPRRRLPLYRTDNEPQVRDGYTSPGTRGHTRARQTRRKGEICRRW
jgi:hypothetical protein